MSSCSPSSEIDIAEHSMCHPGRPRPHGLSHCGSSGFAAFHRTKSIGCSLRESTSMRAPACISSSVRPESWPYVGNAVTRKNTSPSTAYASPLRSRPWMISIIFGIVSVARG